MNKSGIVAFAFGVPCDILSNQRIAQIASQKARALNAPVYTQFDVCIDPKIETERIKEKIGNPPPTLRIAKEAVQWAKRQGFKELWIVAAKPHLWRCLRDVEYAARKADIQIEIKVCEEIKQYPEEEWYCSDSTQLRARSQKEWWKREKILRLLPMWLYRIVAS